MARLPGQLATQPRGNRREVLDAVNLIDDDHHPGNPEDVLTGMQDRFVVGNGNAAGDGYSLEMLTALLGVTLDHMRDETGMLPELLSPAIQAGFGRDDQHASDAASK